MYLFRPMQCRCFTIGLSIEKSLYLLRFVLIALSKCVMVPLMRDCGSNSKSRCIANRFNWSLFAIWFSPDEDDDDGFGFSEFIERFSGSGLLPMKYWRIYVNFKMEFKTKQNWTETMQIKFNSLKFMHSSDRTTRRISGSSMII